MKIKTKLAISFCIIIFVPVVLTSIVLVGFNKIQLKAINKTYVRPVTLFRNCTVLSCSDF